MDKIICIKKEGECGCFQKHVVYVCSDCGFETVSYSLLWRHCVRQHRKVVKIE